MSTLILARLFGLYMIVMGCAYLRFPKKIKEVIQLTENNVAQRYLAGIITTLTGSFVISVHNVWFLDWSLILTLLGWIILLKGVLLIHAETFFHRLSTKVRSSDLYFKCVGTLALLIGLFLSYQGWS